MQRRVASWSGAMVLLAAALAVLCSSLPIAHARDASVAAADTGLPADANPNPDDMVFIDLAGESDSSSNAASRELDDLEAEVSGAAVEDALAEASLATSDADEQADAEAEADDADDEGEDEDEFGMDVDMDLDVDADEQADASVDAEAEHAMQAYAAQSGAIESALDSLSSEAALSQIEQRAEADAEADADAQANAETDAEAEAETGVEVSIGAGADDKTNANAKNGKGADKKKKKHKKPRRKHRGGLAMSQLNLRDEKGEGAKINLAQGKGRYSMGVNAAGVWSVDMEGRTVLSVSGKSGVVRARGDFTVWNTLRAGSLTLNRVPQWKMVRSDTFDGFVPLPHRPADAAKPAGSSAEIRPNDVAASSAAKPAAAAAASSASPSLPPPPPASAIAKLATTPTAAARALAKKSRGWLYDDVIKCNGFSMLSHKPGRTIYTKYLGLPKHTQVRITATVHFIDDWQGETAFMKLNDKFVWTDSHDQKNVAGKFSMCGSDLYPESRFAVPIDVIWTHKHKNLALVLGSNLEEGSDAKFAVSNVAVWTRDTSRPKKKKKKAKKAKAKKNGKKDGKKK